MFYQGPVFWGILVLIGLVAGYFIRQFIAAKAANSIEQKIKKQIEESRARAKEVILEAQGKSTSLLEEVRKEERESKAQLIRSEERLLKKEEQIEATISDFKRKEIQVIDEIEKLKIGRLELEESRQRIINELERVAGLSMAEAKNSLLKNVQDKHQEELAIALQKSEKRIKEEVEKKTVELITTVIQRYARSHVAEITTSIFNLGSEDLKGKIIGREGRNIKALERATGVEFIMDEAPDSIVISSFDPTRREIAKLALQKLIKDGRIQPAKIEEKVEEAKQEINKRMMEIGESAAYDLGIYDLPKEITHLLGRLHFRYSFGQNVLTHSIEMTYLSEMMASELGLNVEVAKKGALLHDIGKAIDQEVEGTHVEIGRKILKKYGISDEVIAAMQSHHEEYPYASPEAYVVTAADVLSAGRPGARRGTVENYLKRLEDLEKIARSFEGIKSAYAISAGRELRIFVTPEKIDDFRALQLAKDVAAKIESELKYPGEIKVNIIREVRAVEYAK